MVLKKIKKDDLGTIISYLNHDTIQNVSKRLGVSTKTLSRFLKESGCYIPRRYNPKPRITLDLQEIARLRLKNVPFREIAKTHKVSPGTIFNALKRGIDESLVTRDLIEKFADPTKFI